MLFVFLSIACKPDMILVSMYLFMLNKLCLSLSLILKQSEFFSIVETRYSYCTTRLHLTGVAHLRWYVSCECDSRNRTVTFACEEINERSFSSPLPWPHFYQTRSAWSMDQGSNENHSPVNNFVPTVTKFCVLWEGQALPQDTKFGNCRDKIVDSRAFISWSLIHGSSWSGLKKLGPGR